MLGTQPTAKDVTDFASVDHHPERTRADLPPNSVIHMDDQPWVGWQDPRTGEKHARIVSKMLLPERERYSASLVWSQPGFESSPHWHPADTLYVILSGAWTVEGEGTYQPGDCRWVPAGTAYGVESTGTEPTEILIISFGPSGRYDADIVPAPNGDMRNR